MKKAILAVLFTAMCSTQALAEQPYVSASMGYGTMNDSGSFSYNGTSYRDVVSFDSGTPWEIAFGIRNDDNRVEVALGYQNNKIDTVSGLSSLYGYSFSEIEVKTRSIMLNGYHDFALENSEISPYLMAGIGSMNLKESVSGTEYGDINKFAWQLGAGIGYKATENITLDISYRYFATADITFESAGAGFSDATYSIGGSRVLAGVRYGF